MHEPSRPMKHIISLGVIILILGGCFSCGSNQKNVKTEEQIRLSENTVTIVFPLQKDSTYSISLGRMSSGEIIRADFNIRNEGSSPLVITKVEHSCGCTRVDYPKEPIMPQKTFEASFTYDSRGKKGMQTGAITIHSSTNEQARIKLEAFVE